MKETAEEAIHPEVLLQLFRVVTRILIYNISIARVYITYNLVHTTLCDHQNAITFTDSPNFYFEDIH